MAELKIESMVSSLESSLQRLYQLHESLLGLMVRKRESLAQGNTNAMIDLSKLENEQVQQISELEKSRLELVAKLTLIVEPNAVEPMHLRELAMRLPEPMRGRVLIQRQRLREKMQQVKDQNTIAKRATESLVKHVQGLVQTISSFASGGASYSDRGTAPANAMAVSRVNIVA